MPMSRVMHPVGFDEFGFHTQLARPRLYGVDGVYGIHDQIQDDLLQLYFMTGHRRQSAA
jgi:hypothetical protein